MPYFVDTYPKMQLSIFKSLMSDLKLTDSSFLNHWNAVSG